jgi:hypothetical protein
MTPEQRRILSDAMHYCVAPAGLSDAIRALLLAHDQAQERVRVLEDALAGVMQLIESGDLVRDIGNDGAANFAQRMLPFVRTITMANAALASGGDKT